MKISEHFSRHEFACPCGCGFDTVDIDLPMLCEAARLADGEQPMTVTSGCRCPAYNKQLQERGYPASDTSFHMWGKAADLQCRNPHVVWAYLRAEYPTRFGFIVYDWGVHVDTRTIGPARGDYRT